VYAGYIPYRDRATRQLLEQQLVWPSSHCIHNPGVALRKQFLLAHVVLQDRVLSNDFLCQQGPLLEVIQGEAHSLEERSNGCIRGPADIAAVL
jgi:hypothetical protein